MMNITLLETEPPLTDRYQITVSESVISHFLSFLSNDMVTHPEHIQVLDESWVKHLQSLVGGVPFDLDAPLPEDEV